MIGDSGLTPAVIKEIDASLNAHGLIKVRVFGDDRAAREQIYQQLCDELNAAPIQHIGKLLVLWRPVPEKPKAEPDEGKRGSRTVKLVTFARKGSPRPVVKTVTVHGNQRVTAGGQIKRAKVRTTSAKKKAQSQ
mgnify:CR=1 FL=1